jgi:hypothetical protein
MTPEEIREDIEGDLCPSWVPQNVADLVWRMAWERGHAHGASEVRFEYDDLMDIVRALAPTDHD